MGKPLSAAHKAAISKALKARNPGGSDKSSTERRKERRANRTPEQIEASRTRRQERRAGKKSDAAPAESKDAALVKSRFADKPHKPLEAPAWPNAHKTGTMGGQHVADRAGHKPSGQDGKDARSMSASDKAAAAAAMFGTGSPQHKKALAAGDKFRDRKKAADAPAGGKFRDRKNSTDAAPKRKSTPEARADERDAQAKARTGPNRTVSGDRRAAIEERTGERRRQMKFASNSPLTEPRKRLGRKASPEARAARRTEIDERREGRQAINRGRPVPRFNGQLPRSS